jgi:EAL domain-containing protein (putative c-di-GMP-specific phosphodiesterase class I)/GGDEF domain-containing protein
MGKLRFYRAFSRLPMFGYAGKAVALAGLAAAFPLAGLATLTLAPEIVATPIAGYVLLGGVAALSFMLVAGLAAYLRAVRAAAVELRACAALAVGSEPATRPRDELAAMIEDMRHISAKFESVRHRLSNRHPVTGVATREPFFTAVAQDLRGQAKNATLGVFRFAQFDRLAAVDRPGAERALRAFAARLTEAAGPGRPLAQVDRDCFALWCCDVSGPKAANDILKTLADRLAEPLGEGEMRVTADVRVGAAIFPNDGVDGPTLLARATAALAKAGRMASARMAFFSDESSAAAQERFSMEQALRQAIVHNELFLHYQPVIDLTNARVVGAEALLRWRHPELGPIPPAQFIPVLEQTGLIDEVGAWILDTACADACGFEALGLSGFKVGVNLSERQFRDPTLTGVVADALQKHGLKPQRLELELTESALMEDLAHTRRVFEDLGALGVSLAIDDFGAGASSLGDLKSLPFGKLKIDRAFVTEVGLRHDSQAICAALIELGRRLDIAVLAEGVETREEVEALRVLGCQLFQGFFFSRPLTADKFKRKVVDPEWLALLASPVHRQLAEVGERLAS